ncbi:MAG: phosphatidylglycerol lysyltransferase domain-containing protein [Deltaproteobacteria bacterium]
MIQSLPLSWSRNDIDRPGFESVYLPLSGTVWAHSAEIPLDYSFERVFTDLCAGFGGKILIRGCSGEIAGFLARNGFGIIRTGAEAVIDLKDLDRERPSVKELARRGIRWGEVEEIPFTGLNSERVSGFTALTAHGGKPNLKYLFRAGFDRATRCFVFRAADEEWLGVVTVSTVAESCAHTEMILRHKKAPVGVMEALFTGVMNILREDGYEEFSLGEVPFITPRALGSHIGSSSDSLKQKMLFRAGRALKFAFDYKGLFRFKNKFNPEWRPVYVCANPELSLLALADLFIVSRYLELSRSELISNIKGYNPLSSTFG